MENLLWFISWDLSLPWVPGKFNPFLEASINFHTGKPLIGIFNDVTFVISAGCSHLPDLYKFFLPPALVKMLSDFFHVLWYWMVAEHPVAYCLLNGNLLPSGLSLAKDFLKKSLYSGLVCWYHVAWYYWKLQQLSESTLPAYAENEQANIPKSFLVMLPCYYCYFEEAVFWVLYSHWPEWVAGGSQLLKQWLYWFFEAAT